MAAIGQITTYEVSQLRQKLQEMFQQLGGLADIIRPGERVTIKPNLTGTTWSDATLPAPTTELFVTHPALVQALAELLIDAGAGQIRIVEGLGDEYHVAEQNIALKLKTLLSAPSNLRKIDEEKALEWARKRLEIQLTDKQKEGIKTAARQKVMVLTGGPGTGRTTIIKVILEVF